jgi:hypothetical protein
MKEYDLRRGAAPLSSRRPQFRVWYADIEITFILLRQAR